MKHIRKCLAGTALALVVLGILMMLGHSSAQTSKDSNPTIGVKLVIDVHRKDGTTYHYVKEGDLMLMNFARWILATFAQNDPDGDDHLVKTGGGAFNPTDINENSMGQICVGTGTNPASINDYKLNNKVACFSVQDADIYVNDNDMIVDVFGSHTFSSAINVTEIGLLSAGICQPGGGVNYVLMFHDTLSKPLRLNAGDAIVVHYYIYLDNP